MKEEIIKNLARETGHSSDICRIAIDATRRDVETALLILQYSNISGTNEWQRALGKVSEILYEPLGQPYRMGSMIRVTEKTLDSLRDFPMDDIFARVIGIDSRGVLVRHCLSNEIYAWGYDEVEIIHAEI